MHVCMCVFVGMYMTRSKEISLHEYIDTEFLFSGCEEQFNIR